MSIRFCKKLFLILAFVFLFSVNVFANNLPDNDIVILYTNDVHCAVDESIGYAGVKFYVDEMKKLTPYVTLVDAGDHTSGGVIGVISNGRYLIQIMNETGYDIAIPGNHEFDSGWAVFENYIKNLKCGYLACNLIDLKTGKPILPAYKILNYGDTKIAFVGVTTPSSVFASKPSSFMDDEGNFIYDLCGDVKGERLVQAVQNAVDEARRNGADYVILVAHLGENKDGLIKEWGAPFIAENTRGINAVIDAHSHEVTPALKLKNLDGQEVIITQTGTKLIYLGKLVINTKGKLTTQLLSKNEISGRDEHVTNFINELKARYEETLKNKIAYVSFDLRATDEQNNWLIRNAETGLCNLITDAFLNSAAETPTGKADIAICNGGGIRANIKAGEINFGDVLDVAPFSNLMCIIEMPGQTILDALEFGAKLLPVKSGAFLHTAGLTYKVNTSIPTSVIFGEHGEFLGVKGERRVYDVFVNGEKLDPEKIYKVAGTDYTLRAGGDGYRFNNSKVIEDAYMLYAEAISHYLKKLQVVPEKYNAPENRVIIK